MINDPKSCSLIKTRRTKMDQEGKLWEGGVVGVLGGFWEGSGWVALGVGSVFFLEGTHPLIESVRFWRLGRRVLVGGGGCLDWLVFVGVLFLLLGFLFHVKMMWDQELLGRVQFCWCSMHLMFQTRFGFQVSILVFFFVGAKTSSHAYYSLANGAGILAGTMASVRTSYFGSTLHPVANESL